ncbi:MAG: signal peptidase II [Alphaproteobacteria bacterium]
MGKYGSGHDDNNDDGNERDDRDAVARDRFKHLEDAWDKSVLYGFAIAAGILAVVADQASKWWILEKLSGGRSMEVMPFLRFDLVWNKGITFGMLGHDHHGSMQSRILSALSFAIMFALVQWLMRVKHPFAATGIGLVIGGALGNVIDRAQHEAVVDFIHFSFYPWVFNVADSAIMIGVALLLIDSFLNRHEE